MYYNKIRLIGLNNVDLPIFGALPSNPYILKAADGLGPPELDVAMASTRGMGGVYQGRQALLREIVLRVGLNPSFALEQTAADLRTALYGLLTTNSGESIDIQLLHDDEVVLTTSGYMRRLEASMFTKEPEVQLTILCTSPYFSGPEVVSFDGLDKNDPELLNPGTAPSGFQLSIQFNADTGNWKLTDAQGNVMFFVYSFLNNDTLVINTEPGHRSVKRIRSGVELDLIYTMSLDSTWLMLYAGNNVFETSSPNFNWVDVEFSANYWGV